MAWPKEPWPKNWTKDWTKNSTKNWVAARSVRPAGVLDGDSMRRTMALGWHPDMPDLRDMTLESSTVKAALQKAQLASMSSAALPSKCDHRKYCSPIEDQGELGSCTAQAVVGVMEYMMRRSGSDHIDGSRLFVYKVARKLLGWEGDTGAYLRTAMKAVGAFGIPPETHWPYIVERFEEEPDAFLYSYASNYKALNYTLLDPIGQPVADVLQNVKQVVAHGFPVAFGFSVYNSIDNGPGIPYPSPEDTLSGGHAVMIVGYDDEYEIGQETGAFIIRNSWGRDWGNAGYGYLPYRYVTDGLAQDFWTVFKWDWLATGQFNLSGAAHRAPRRGAQSKTAQRKPAIPKAKRKVAAERRP